jgi:hypothetical protein
MFQTRDNRDLWVTKTRLAEASAPIVAFLKDQPQLSELYGAWNPIAQRVQKLLLDPQEGSAELAEYINGRRAQGVLDGVILQELYAANGIPEAMAAYNAELKRLADTIDRRMERQLFDEFRIQLDHVLIDMQRSGGASFRESQKKATVDAASILNACVAALAAKPHDYYADPETLIALLLR